MKNTGMTGAHTPVVEPKPRKRRMWERFDGRLRLPMIITIAAAATVILLAVAMLGTADVREYNRYMKEAEQHIRDEDFDSALSDLRKAAAINGSSECALLMAGCYQVQGNYEKALTALNLAKEPNEAVISMKKEIERERAKELAATKLNIAGKLVDYGAQTLVLDAAPLNGALPEELKELRSLNNLSAISAGISDISLLSDLKGIVTLNLSGNNIKDISVLTELKGLRKLYLDDNPVDDLTPILSLTGLTALSIRGMEIDRELLDALSTALPDCTIFSDMDDEERIEISLGGQTFRSDVKELNLSNTGIKDISALSCCNNLRKLNLSGNKISDISPLVNIPSLEWLDISDNQISDLNPLISISTLRTLYAQNNRINGTAAVGAMSALMELNLSNNPIEDFSGLKKLRELKSLCMSACAVTDEGLSYLEYISSLTRLELDNNPDLSAAAVESFQRAVPGCTIIHSNIVYTLEIGGQSGRTDAHELDISYTGTADISSLGSMECLQTADLSGNGISNIYILCYTNSRRTLRELNLSGNALEDITPLSWLTAIETLDLSGNNISSLQPLMSMTWLKKLDLSGNPLDNEELDALREALPDCEIEFLTK